MEQTIKDKIERIKEKANIFLEKNIKAFIVDANNSFYFCDIRDVDEDSVLVFCFAGKRKDQQDRLFFVDILKFEQYEELGEKNG